MPAKYIMPSRYQNDLGATLLNTANQATAWMDEERKKKQEEDDRKTRLEREQADRTYIEGERKYDLDQRSKVDAITASMGDLVTKKNKAQAQYAMKKSSLEGAMPAAEQAFQDRYSVMDIGKNQIGMPTGMDRKQNPDKGYLSAREQAPIGMLEKDLKGLAAPDMDKYQQEMDIMIAERNRQLGKTEGIDPSEFAAKRAADKSRLDADVAYKKQQELNLGEDNKRADRTLAETERKNKEDERIKWYNARKEREDKLTEAQQIKVDNEAYKRASTTAKTVEGSDVTRAATALEDLDSVLFKHTGKGLVDAKDAQGIGAFSDVPGRDLWESRKGNEAFTQTKQTLNKLSNMILRREAGASLTSQEAQKHLQATLNKPGVLASTVLDAARSMAASIANDVLLLESPILNAKDEAGVKASTIYREGFGGKSWSDRVGKFSRVGKEATAEDYLGEMPDLKNEIAQRRANKGKN